MRKPLHLSLLILLSAAGWTAAQQPGGGPDRSTIFQRLDRDRDGRVTKQEFMSHPRVRMNPAGGQQRFLSMDRDGSGSLSRTEFMAGPGGSPARPAPVARPQRPPTGGPSPGRQPDPNDEPAPADPNLDTAPEDVPEEPLPELKPESVDDKAAPGPTPAPAPGRLDIG